MIDNILTSNYNFDDNEHEVRSKYILFNSLLIFNILIVSIATIIRLFNAQYMQAFFDLIYIVPSMSIFIFARIFRDQFDRYIYYVLFLSYLVVSLSFYVGLNFISGISWYLVLLVSSFFLKGKKTGNIVFIISLIAILLISVNKHIYSTSEICLGVIPLFVIVFFMHFFEQRNQNFKKELQTLNRILKEKNSELNEEVQYKSHEILKLNQILDKSPVSIVITNKEGNIEYVNPWFSELTGYNSKEIIGKNSRILKSDLHSVAYYKKLWDEITSKKVWNGTFKNIKKSGDEYWESAIIAPVNDKNGELAHFIAIKQEITQQVYLKTKLIEKDKEIIENFEKTLESFVKMVEERDTYTAGHSKRVAKYSQLIAREMKLSDEECQLIYRAGILHDIGKIATPDNVLLKPDKLSSLEYKLIQEHVQASYDILVRIPMYQGLADIIINHHERYDGKGYPNGLKGDEISILSHIMILADSFDAMTTNRIYRGKKDILDTMQRLEVLAGKQFHPDVVKYAKKALKNIEPMETINQLPKSDLEKERFSYFYRDQVTDVYNADYLKFILSQNYFKQDYDSINVLYMHNFSIYNNKYGWAKGDILLCKVADYLNIHFSDRLIFRIYGDDFVIIGNKPIEIDMEELKSIKILQEHNITLTNKYIDLKKEDINDIADLERLKS